MRRRSRRRDRDVSQWVTHRRRDAQKAEGGRLLAVVAAIGWTSPAWGSGGQCPSSPTNWDAEDCVVGGVTVCYSGSYYINGSWVTEFGCDLSGASTDSEVHLVEDYDTSTPGYEAWGDYGGTPFCCSVTTAAATPTLYWIIGSDYADDLEFHWGYGGSDYNLRPATAAAISGIVNAQPGSDAVVGSNYSGADYSEQLNGQDDDDDIQGLGGDDAINGGSGNDTCNGGAGNDDITGEAGSDVLSGSSGLDTIDGGTEADTIYGGPDTDALSGGPGNDTIHGDANPDYLYGGGDDDYLYGDANNDYLAGDAGNDHLYGGGGADTMYGGDGNDSMVGDSGDDLMYGTAGNDLMSGNDGADYLDGGIGDDQICGDAEVAPGDQLLDGDADPGIDLLYGASAMDYGVSCNNVSTRVDSWSPVLAGPCSATHLTSPPACP